MAEVLITLGIIGVVAALTLPALISYNKKVEIETRLKRVYSAMNQAVIMSQANDTWTKPPLDQRYDSEALQEWLQVAIFPYLKDVEIFNEHDLNHPQAGLDDLRGIRFTDGSTMFFLNNVQIHIHYDINGTKAPNIAGKDIFYFMLDYSNNIGLGNFYPGGYTWVWDDENNKGLDVYAYGDREKMKSLCALRSRANSIGGPCALLIMTDGWQVSKDYPIKL